LAYQEALAHVPRIVAYDETGAQTPEQGLLFEIAWSEQVAKALAEVCKSVIDDNQITTKSSGHGDQLNALLRMWADERVTHARLCALALSAGIQQRQLDLVEAQANQIVSAMLNLLMSPRLGLTAEQIIEGRVVASEVLRSLPGAAQALPVPIPQ
jgi:hypothetical protein